MVTKFFRFGHRIFKITMPEDMICPENFDLFCIQKSEACTNGPDAAYCNLAGVCEIAEKDSDGTTEQHSDEIFSIEYLLEFTDDIGRIASEVLKRKVTGSPEVIRDNLHVLYTEEGECRLIRIQGAPVPYAVSIQEKAKFYHVYVDRAIGWLLESDPAFAALLSLERHMIEDGAMILHSAYMCWKDMAVLFSAPSETGKSTQSGLWEKYRGTRQVNGDRSLLIYERVTQEQSQANCEQRMAEQSLVNHEQGCWMAYGWPVCGSSEICHNEAFPIKAIVMLKQAKENHISRLKGLQALRLVMEQITINSWNREFQMKAMDQIDLLLREIPVYLLECDMSEDAVVCLEKVLEA